MRSAATLLLSVTRSAALLLLPATRPAAPLLPATLPATALLLSSRAPIAAARRAPRAPLRRDPPPPRAPLHRGLPPCAAVHGLLQHQFSSISTRRPSPPPVRDGALHAAQGDCPPPNDADLNRGHPLPPHSYMVGHRASSPPKSSSGSPGSCPSSDVIHSEDTDAPRQVVEQACAKKRTPTALLQLNSSKVVAVGPGGRDKEGKLIPVSLKEGDHVLLPEYGGLEVKLLLRKKIIQSMKQF